ncbi:hypothetical protein P3S68_021879 [Capsicum galapagoense]
MVGLESLTEGLEDFAFEDYLNDPKDSESFRPVDMHHGVEVHLGLSKGPIAAAVSQSARSIISRTKLCFLVSSRNCSFFLDVF